MKSSSPIAHAKRLIICLVATGSLFLSGCMFSPGGKNQKSGSVVAFLFPKENPPVQTPAMPVLQLPLRVGIAFVPQPDQRFDDTFTEMQKKALLEKASAQFRSMPFVQSIEVIPGMYLRAGGSFDNLDQLRALLGIDVIVLLGYDQMQFTDTNVFSLSYWTIVGAYIFHGNRNDTHTMMEAVVYDIPSRSLLFRAPGVDQTKATSALVYMDQDLRRDSGQSFDRATADLAKNLETALTEFRQTVREGKRQVQVAYKPGYSASGMGAIDSRTLAIMLVVFLVITALYARKHMGRRSRQKKE
jgi:rhombotail lipoprotein